jgi:hypothetical protein
VRDRAGAQDAADAPAQLAVAPERDERPATLRERAAGGDRGIAFEAEVPAQRAARDAEQRRAVRGGERERGGQRSLRAPVSR